MKIKLKPFIKNSVYLLPLIIPSSARLTESPRPAFYRLCQRELHSTVSAQPEKRVFCTQNEQIELSGQSAVRMIAELPEHIRKNYKIDTTAYPAQGVKGHLDLRGLTAVGQAQEYEVFKGGIFDNPDLKSYLIPFDNKQGRAFCFSYAPNAEINHVNWYLILSGNNTTSLLESRPLIQTLSQTIQNKKAAVVCTYDHPGQGIYGLNVSPEGQIEASSLSHFPDPAKAWQNTFRKFIEEVYFGNAIPNLNRSNRFLNIAAQSASVVPTLKGLENACTVYPQLKVRNFVASSPYLWLREDASLAANLIRLLPANGNKMSFDPRANYWETPINFSGSFEAKRGLPLPPEIVLRALTGLGSQYTPSADQIKQIEAYNREYLSSLASRQNTICIQELTVLKALGDRVLGWRRDDVVSRWGVKKFIETNREAERRVKVVESDTVPHNFFILAPEQITRELTK